MRTGKVVVDLSSKHSFDVTRIDVLFFTGRWVKKFASTTGTSLPCIDLDIEVCVRPSVTSTSTGVVHVWT
jgi:hypothetical protein